MVDVTSQIDSVQRKLGKRVIEAGEAVTATVSQVYDTGLDDLWDACTNPERIPRWFLPVSGELRVGGKYQLEGNAGGTIERCDPPKSFAATWEYGGDVSWIELRLTPEADGRTRFELDHTAVAGEHWNQFGPGAVGIGWDMMLNGLALHLESDEAADPEAAMAWMTSEEGVRFMTLSNEAWYEADVANGTDAATARTRADATLAAYTAPPES
ncbi:polyketide cyclase [Amycolatopsis sp. WAC 04169]|uniref:SRPBCC family protein n=1 Tax=Amycolatopsis sp. WAC 04169 TaxID=2203197 RepID=UPI000F799586|nr:SRPBCC family protein [Amycolatopsis sp. WAC 04169]RSN37372.1 polyketide cyclase [Amycolatopsis sp. WAC 04169]